jgi:anti-sigma regulatory factor (Ser/Thr protein kinase)
MSAETPDEKRRVISRVSRTQFVGRAGELQRIVAHPRRRGAAGLLLLLAPTAGVSELLRQAYDEIFNQRGAVIPFYFALPREEETAVSTAIEFLNAFVSQYLAFRRNDPLLCQAASTLNELLALAPPADYEWLEQLVAAYNRERFSNDDAALIRWCLSAPQRVPPRLGRVFTMLDAVPLMDGSPFAVSLGAEMIRVLSRSSLPYLVAGLRRQLLKSVQAVQCNFEDLEILRLERLSEDDGRALVEGVAHRQNVEISDEVRDLLVQQFESSPFFIASFIHAAREMRFALASYLACEKLYAEELLGGTLARYFSALLETIAPDSGTRRTLIRVLYEASQAEELKASFESWKRKSDLDEMELERILQALHVQEFISWDGSLIQAGGGPMVWKDYLQARYRVEIAGEPRALVVAETITRSLKRAPQTMARYYRRAAAVGLREVLARFDGQRVPAILLDYGRFSEAYKGLELDVIGPALDEDKDIFRLPQVVHVANCTAFNAQARQVCDEERCAVAHAFSEGRYTDANQVVWLAAEIDAKLETDLDRTRSTYDRLKASASESGFETIRIWLIAREGFSPEASQFLAEREAYGSSRQQFELLTARLDESQGSARESKTANEFEMVVPMGGDNELIVAHTVEEIARRLNFRPEAINQIKHAVVEAFINASEHSLSPDRKIYQRFRVETDKLIITISSRGIVPITAGTRNGEKNAAADEGNETSANRRGLGLNMIKTLMDEVEFERVDDGTSLRMTKYLRP